MTAFVRVVGILWWVSAALLAAGLEDAERLYQEGSYQLAHEAFQRIDASALDPDNKRWIEFRLAETLARSAAGSRQGDDSSLRQAESALRKYIAEDAPKDRVWAEAHETFGDMERGARGNLNPGGAWPHYSDALEYWGGSTNLVLAADKYWQILRKAAEPAQIQPLWYFGSFGIYIPLPVLENALKIARNDEERARAHFMIAMTLRASGGDWEQRFRIPEEFEAALKLKKDSRWYDDALYFYGEWMTSNGRAVQDENGNWRTEPDFEKALALFRRLVAEFRKGETPWLDDAQNRIRDITQESVDLHVSNTFLPGSEIEFQLRTRNINTVTFNLYSVDLTEDFSFQADNTEWQSGFSPNRAKQLKSWKKTIDKKRPHTPSSENIRLDESLPLGAYVLEAKSGNTSHREMLLVTDAALVIQSAGRQALVYSCDSTTGAPLASSQVTLWERYYENSKWRWKKQSRQSDAQGLALFELNSPQGNPTLLASCKSGEKQAFSYGASSFWPVESESWKIFAFPDKPAYRPGEKVQWKIVARRHRGETYSTPSGQKLNLRLFDPRGAEVRKQAISLNDFGSAWGSFDLNRELPLGEYQVVFELANREIGRGPLFRLEEYKLPEFKVTVRTPEEGGRKKAFLLGEQVEVEVLAEYYSGGPVANASAEIVVYQAPYYRLWTEPREYSWFFGNSLPFRPRDPGQVIQRETVKTDAQGKAKLSFTTPISTGSELEYRIEARVTDASRREIVGSDSVRVGLQRFYVYPNPARKIYKPQDKVEVEFRVLDANEQPLAAEGTVRVTRDYWFEVWLAPDGREVKGAELKQLQSAAIFPPVPPPGQKPWRLKFRGYEQDQILTRSLKSGTNGLANLVFTPEREGFYRITWRTDEAIKPGVIPSRPIRAESMVWVATTQSAEIGYRSGRFEILVDKDTFRAGQKAVVMLSAPAHDRYILLTATSGTLLDYRLVHLDGSVKLLEFDIDEKHVPNFFLHGTMVADQEISADQKEIVVPPVKNFLTVQVESDRSEFRPGETGKMRVRTLDSEGMPVSAEIALTVYDDSVSYIQQDYAGDPRQFFFGTKRPNLLSSLSSFNYRPYRKVLSREAEEDLSRQAVSRDESMSYEFGGSRGELFDGARAKTSRSLNLAARGLDQPSATPALMKSEALLEAKAAHAPAAEPAVEVRSDFRSAVVWEPALRTGIDGRAEVSFAYPESLTSWKAVARVVTRQNQFGIDDALTRTRQPLSIRIQAPRFFLAGDTVTISALINNNTAESFVVSPELNAEGLSLDSAKRDPIRLAPGAEARADWIARPAKPGAARLKAVVRGGRYSDAMENTFPIYEHGIEKFLATSGKSQSEQALASLDLPAERKPGSTGFTIQVTPSLAVTMLDALPYLINYPYGCTEQTMSRFLPAAITSKTLKDLGLSTEDVLNRVFGGIEPNTPKGPKRLEQLADITRQGLERLYNFQHSDGGWGWWKEGESDRFMTAYVVWGLALARSGGVSIDAPVLARGAAFLNTQLIEAERDYDLQAFMLHALTASSDQLSQEQLTAFRNLWEHRDPMNAYSRALLALAAHGMKKETEAQTLVQNLANGVKRDTSSGQTTAHWGEDGLHWRWSEGGVEATAFALRALLAIDPKNELVEPVATWLIKNRRGAQWSNTRDTAIVLLALNDYLRSTGELKGDLEYEVFVNDQSLGTHKITGTDVFNAPKKFHVPENIARNGPNSIRIQRKSGDAPIYFAAECSFFSLEEPITPAGHEIFVKRRYYRITPVPTLLKGYTYRKDELRPGDSIRSGDRIETVLTIEAKNNYEYLVFEDLKPSGVEVVEIRSGESLYAHRVRESSLQAKPALLPSSEPVLQKVRASDQTGESRWVYQELRDRQVALFIDKLPQGFWEIRYEARAEAPGEFHALPVLGHAMYVPEIRANSAEMKIKIYDSEKGDL